MINSNHFDPNVGKRILIDVDGRQFARLPIRTHVISDSDNIAAVCVRYAKPHLQKDDIVFISEKVVAISQGRAFHVNSISPSRMAIHLSKFVHRSKHGIGLGSPATMQLAIKQAGLPRILFAAVMSAITKPFGIKGVFYWVVGKNVNAIDGPCAYTLPPYNEYAKLPPVLPNQVAIRIKRILGNEVVIIDANDLGVNILGKSSSSLSDKFCKGVFRDNPLGQSREQTPLSIVRAAYSPL